VTPPRGAKLRAALPYAAVLLCAVFFYGQTSDFAALGREGNLGPAFWPRAVLLLLMLVCVLEMVRAAFFFRPDPSELVVPAAGPVPETEDAPRLPMLLAGGIVITLLYVPAMEMLGFFLATILYLASFMWIGRYRRPGIVALTSVLGTVAFVFVFMKVVYVSLPLGAGPFRQFSAWILAALGVY
jgi:putative tricarboxylic transport membrane protein